MKTIEEKAKAYDEALKVLHKYDGANIMFSQSLKEEMFPELAESEDEKIRKALIRYFTLSDEHAYNEACGVSYRDIVTWLEKQGEQKLPIEKLPSEMKTIGKSLGFTTQEDCDRYNQMVSDLIMSDDDKGEQNSADKAEPKFKVGDWIVYDKYYIDKIVKFNNDKAIFESGAWLYINQLNEDCKLWTIEDAKDGDVLATPNYIYIFNSIDKEIEETVCYYCLLKESDKSFSFGDSNIHDEILNSVPATKEQRDLLFQKMKENGYEWDAEKKELKKIEQGNSPLLSNSSNIGKNEDKVEPKFKVGDWIVSKTSNLVYCVDSILYPQSKCYYLSHNGGIVLVSFADEQNYRLWTIEDAKDGDILAVDNVIYIYKRILGSHIVSYCKLINDIFESSVDARTYCEGNAYTHPATKEQCDLLFKKMKEADYEWDVDKKELKKIEQNLTWSEEDERILNGLISSLVRIGANTRTDSTSINYTFPREINWLKSLKQRIVG